MCSGAGTQCSIIQRCVQVVVLVDPVDGTRELVEGRLGAVQTLVGVAVRGRALAGAVGLPFPCHQEGEEAPVVVYGLVGSGHGTYRAGREVAAGTGSPGVAGEPGLLYTSGDSANPALAAAKQVLVGVSARAGAGAEWRLMGGAGNKLLAAAEGRVAAALMHTGTSLWDTCAPEAVVVARGGSVTDLFGAPIKYFLDRRGGLINQFGVLGLAPGFEAGWGASPGAVWAGMRACPSLLRLLEPYTGTVTASCHHDTIITTSSPQAPCPLLARPRRVTWPGTSRGRLSAPTGCSSSSTPPTPPS